MFTLPQLPDWNALHVLVVHFPIGLLMMAAPALLLCAIMFPKHAKPLAAAAGVMLIIGTAGAYLATSTGEAAAKLAQSQGALEDEAIEEAFEKHEHMAEDARNYFTYFTAVFLLYLLVIGVRKDELHPALNALILAVFLGGNGLLALAMGNAVHEGGVLVHTHGITAPLEPGAGNAAAAASMGDGESAADDNSGPGSNSGSGGDKGNDPNVDYD